MTLELNLQKGLVGHWTLDDADTSGGTLYDSSANDSHATIVGATTGQSGVVGEAYSFNATDDEVQTTAPLPSQADFSISYWFKTTASVTDGNPVVSNWGSSAEGVNTGVPSYSASGGVVDIAIRDISNGDNDHLVTENSYNDGNFHHAVVTRNYNPSDGTNQLNIYVDGNDVPTTIERSQTADDLDTTNLLIGRDNWASDTFDGELDDVRLYNRVLSANEVSALYNMRSQRQKTNDLAKGLVGHWTMDDADTSGGTLYDRGAYDNHATIDDATTGQSGVVGESYLFDATDDSVTIPNNSINLDGSFTATAWIYPNGWGENGFGRIMAGVNGIQWYLVDSNSMTFRDGINHTADGLVLNEWQLVTARLDTGSSTFDMFVNETNEFSTSESSTLTSNTADITVGNTGVDGGRTFDGRIGELRLYERALSDSEISALYNNRT